MAPPDLDERAPSPRDLKLFGALLPPFFALAGWLLGRATGWGAAAPALWIGGALLAALYLARPRLRPRIYQAWRQATYPIAWLVAHLVLLVIYFLVITPVALGLRLARRDPLERRLDPGAKSYWQPRAPARDDSEAYLRRF